MWCWAGPPVCVCVWCRACLPVCMWLSVWCRTGPSVCVYVVCGVGQVRLCMCVIHGMPSSCRSAGESECVLLGRSACVCVCVCLCVCLWCLWCLAGSSMCVWYVECRVVVDLLDRVSVWCWAGPSVCVCVCGVVRPLQFMCLCVAGVPVRLFS